MKKLIVLIISLTCVLSSLTAQKRPPNIPHYDERWIHFGFHVGYNQYSAMLKVKDPLPDPEKVLGMNVEPQSGFQVELDGK